MEFIGFLNDFHFEDDMNLERLKELMAKATPGPFEYRIGDDLNNSRQVPCVIGAGIVDRSCVARHADDPEGHADAELHAALRNSATDLIAAVEAAMKLMEEHNYITGMSDNNPHKGAGNYLADALEKFK